MLLQKIRPHLKQVFYLKILSEVNDKPISNNDIHENKACTLPPYAFWQKCPDGQIPVGSKGYKNETCTHWYQKFSGSLLCMTVEPDTKLDIQSSESYKKIQDLYSQYITTKNKIEANEIISELIADTLAYLDTFPKIKLAHNILKSIYKKYLSTFEQVEDIFLDLVDVCNTLSCNNNSDCNVSVENIQTMLKRQCNKTTCQFTKPSQYFVKMQPDIDNIFPGYLGSIIQPF
jgi:hypothetical protein